MVVGEVALSLMLLVGATLMVRTLLAIEHLDLGIRADRLLTMRIPRNQDHFPDERVNAFLAELLRRIRALPGVITAGLNTGMHPLWNWWLPVEMPENSQQDERRVQVDQTDENYTKALGIGLASGRLFTDTEVANRTHVAVVNRAFVHRYIGFGNALGRLVRIPRFAQPPVNLANDSFLIVGVVNDAVNDIRNRETIPELYLPYTVLGWPTIWWWLPPGRRPVLRTPSGLRCTN